MTLYRYRAFGLSIESEWPLTELAETDDGAVGEPDLRIVLADIGRPIPPPDAPSQFDFGDPQGVVMLWPHVGGFRIRLPDVIEMRPAETARPEYVAFPLLGPVIAWYLHLRGRMILHASALVWRGQAFGFMGDKMAGKSTTAAAFLRDGGQLLTDDLLVFDMDDPAGPAVQPAFAQLKLSEESAESVPVEGAEALPLIIEGFPKRQHRLDRLADRPDGFDALFVLRRGGERARVEWLDQTEALTQLARFSYNVRFDTAPPEMLDRRRHFQHCAALARAVKVGVLHIPADLDRLPETVESVGRALGVDG